MYMEMMHYILFKIISFFLQNDNNILDLREKAKDIAFENALKY